MEEYKKIYPEVPKEVPKETPKEAQKDKIYPEAPKDGKTFRLQQSCRVLGNLEKEAKHYASVRKKYKRCLNVLSRISTSTGTLSFCLSGSGVGNSFFWGWPASRRITWRPWSYLWSCECYRCRIGEKGFSKSDETRKNCFCLRVKN